ncbi:MAG: CoA pyrophosphatase [Gemmatimonadota bacterium]
MSRLPDLHDALSRHQPREVVDPTRREAAVAIVLAPGPDRLLLIVRAERQGDPWSGHLACPGGRREPGDDGLLTTAIRETAEEVGLDLRTVSRPIQLDDLAPTTPSLPPLLVRPFLFVLDREANLQINGEVAGYHWVTLESLATENARRPASIEIAGTVRRVAGYQLVHGLLWGLTERIVTPVVARWKEVADRAD